MRIATWSLAASILAAVGAVLLWGGSSNVALADVLEAAEKHKLVKYKTTETVETKDGSALQPNVYVDYADLKAPRSRKELRMPGHLSGAIDFESVSVYDVTRNVAMHVTTETVTEKGKTDPELIEMLKSFEKQGVPRKEVRLTRIHDGDKPPPEQARPLLAGFRELEKHKDAVAAKGKLGGKDVLKYRIEDGNKTTVLWVDAATKLPVRMDFEIENLNEQTPRYRAVLSDFEWDPEVKGFKGLDEIFSTTPPEGYKVTDEIKNPPKKSDFPAPNPAPENP